MRLSGVAILLKCSSLGSCPAFAVLVRRFVLGLRPAFAVLLGQLLARFTRGDVVLAQRFALGSRPALRFCWGRLPRFTPAVCRMATNRTACDILRFYSAGSRSLFVRSRSALRLSALAGSLRVCAFICGDLDGVSGDAGSGAGGAAFVRLCAATLAL